MKRLLLLAGAALAGTFTLSSGSTVSASSASSCGAGQRITHIPGFREEMVGGGGPALLMEVAGQHGSRISVAHSPPDKLGWRGQKTPWLVRKDYRGPIIVTARRIDGSGQVRFALVYGQHLRKLTYAEDDRNPPVHGYYGLPSTTLFRATGCYAFRVRGRAFRERLVIRVVA